VQEWKQEKKDALDADEVKTREDLAVLFKQDLEYTQSQFKPKTAQDQSSGFQIARIAREKRQKKEKKVECHQNQYL